MHAEKDESASPYEGIIALIIQKGTLEDDGHTPGAT